jgi:ankyrin repeat protein
MRELWLLCDDPDLSNKTDLREWNLLHVAVGAGRFDTIPYLLGQGVDPGAKSRATCRFVPPALTDKSVTPSDVAVNCGPEAFQRWSEALDAVGLTLERQYQDIDWTTKDIEGQFGGCECCQQWAFSS